MRRSALLVLCALVAASVGVRTADAATIVFGSSAPVVDGSVDAVWADANTYPIANVINGTVSGDSDLSGTWRAVWTADNLYYLAEVTDDALWNDSANTWDDDCVELYIDADNSKGTSYDGVNDFQYIFRWNDGSVHLGVNSATNTAGIVFDMVAVSGGYAFECSIPWTTLGVTPTAGNLVGIDVHLNDDDDGGARDGKKAWYATTDDSWSNPSTFGTADLGSPGGDVTPPDPPTGLTATAVSDSQIDLDWDDNTEPDLASYRLYRDTSSGGPYGLVAVGLTSSDHSDTGLTASTTYYYVVTAVDDSANESGYSNEADATTAGDVTPPAAPTGLVAIGEDGQVYLNWNDNTEPDLASYSVYRDTSSGGPYGQIASGVPSSSHTDTGVANGTTYYYVVTAVDASSNESGYSTEASATPQAGTAGQMVVGTNFWNIGWGNQWHDYFVDGIDWNTVTNPWKQEFLDEVAPYNGPLRFMDWVPTNNSTVRYWSERIQKTASHYNTGGVAYEWQIDLCNRLGNDIWITVPHLTVEDYEANPNNNYWTELADLLIQELDPSLKVWVEYSNETWNGMFTQGSYCGTRGVQAGYDTDSYTAAFYFHVYAAVRLHETFLDAFAGQQDRVVTVVAGQSGSGWGEDLNWGCYCQMQALQDAGINPSSLVPDYYVLANYAGGSLDGASGNIRSEWTAAVADTVDAAEDCIRTIQLYGPADIPLSAYEGGQHITTNSDVFARNPESYDMYLELLAAVDDLYEVTAHYLHVGTWGSGGAWGAMEYTGQPIADAHKYRALVTYTADSTPPAPPANLSASAGEGQVDLDWDDNTEPDLDGYNVYRDTSSGGPYTQIAVRISTSQHTDIGLTNGVTYYYVVTALDASSNESSFSNEVSATPQDTGPPAAPTGLTATAGDAVVGLDWDDNAEPDLDSYSVYRDTTSGGPYTQIDSGVLGSDYSDTMVTNGTTYYYVVTAVDTSLNESGHSNEAEATPTDLPPGAPTGLDAVAGNGWVALDWDDNTEPDLASYSVYRHTTSGGPYGQIASGVATSDYTDGTVSNETTYYYVVTAVDSGSNESAYSSEVSATPSASGSITLNPNADANDYQGNTACLDASLPFSMWDYAFIRFDLAGVLGPVTSATFRVYYLTGDALTMSLYDAASDVWDECGTCPAQGSNAMGSQPASSIGWYEFDVTTYVAAEADGDDLITFCLLNDQGGWKSVSSREGTYPPELVVDWSGGDTTPPAAPTNLAATAGDGVVDLDWDDNSEPDLASYSVYRDTSSGGPYGQIASGVATSDYSDSTVTNGTTYYYVVTAVDTSSNESGYSNEASATPQGDVTPPAAPANLSATAGDGVVDLDWDDNSEPDLDSYSVYRDTSSGGPYSQIDSGIATSDYSDSGVTNGTTYYYVVTAVDTSSNESGYSNEASATPQGDITPPAAPTNLSATAGDGVVDLDWDDNSEPDLDSYSVYRGTSSGGPYGQIASGVANSDYSDTEVTNGVTYYYVVTAVDSSTNESGYSNEASATPQDTTPPDAPTNLSATGGDGVVDLDWDDNSEPDLDSYSVYRDTSGGGPYGQIASGVANSDCSDTDVTNGVTYYYVVTAVDTASNESGYSDEALATPNAQAATMHIHSIVVEWIEAGGPNRKGQATVVIKDNLGNVVQGATVTGTFSGTLSETQSGTTDGTGTAVIQTKGKTRNPGGLTFCVDGVTHATLDYAPGDNVETCDSI
jgi:fibronectin type 3 domain-containing protein